MPPNQACRCCMNLMRFPSEGGSQHDTTYANILSSASSGCQSCQILQRGIETYTERSDFQRVVIRDPGIQGSTVKRQINPLPVKLPVSQTEILSLAFYTDNEKLTEKWPLVPIVPHISQDSSSSTCLEQAKGWLDHCVYRHGNDCRADQKVIPPTRLIAVGKDQDLHLYETYSGTFDVVYTYAALSYCWGSTRSFTTTLSTYQERKIGFKLEELPKTCRDAVVVARALGIPFLWIDSLCIIQDSPEDWEKEAAKMCDVYSNAHITLAGLDSPDSDTGLFVGRHERRTVSLPVQLNDGSEANVYVRAHYDMTRLGFFHAGYSKDLAQGMRSLQGVLETRGWTLQELTLSPRILWFSSWELGFSCRTETACECDPKPQIWAHIMGTRGTFGLNLTTTPPPNSLSTSQDKDWHQTWQDFVGEYTKRQLSHHTDRLPAMSGLAKAMRKRIGGEYYAGIWEKQIEQHLLWANDWGQGGLEVLSGSFGIYLDKKKVIYTWEEFGKLRGLPEGYAPSWSWASVPGKISLTSCRGATGPLRILYKVFDVWFKPSSSNAYGPGEGAITLAGPVLPVSFEDGANLIFDNSPRPKMSDLLYDTTPALLPAESLFMSWSPPRIGHLDMRGPVVAKKTGIFADLRYRLADDKGLKQYVLLFAGLYSTRRGSNVEDAFVGLVLERLEDRHFKRVALVDVGLDDEKGQFRWADWEGRCKDQILKLV